MFVITRKTLTGRLMVQSCPNAFAALTNRFLDSYMNPADLRRELLETSFIVGAHSWILKRPVISRIRYDGGIKKFVAASTRFPKKLSPSLYGAGQFAIIGDLRSQYMDCLGGFIDYQKATRFDMQPFSALASMLGDEEFTDRRGKFKGPIGGAPQLLKNLPFLTDVGVWGLLAKPKDRLAPSQWKIAVRLRKVAAPTN